MSVPSVDDNGLPINGEAFWMGQEPGRTFFAPGTVVSQEVHKAPSDNGYLVTYTFDVKPSEAP